MQKARQLILFEAIRLCRSLSGVEWPEREGWVRLQVVIPKWEVSILLTLQKERSEELSPCSNVQDAVIKAVGPAHLSHFVPPFVTPGVAITPVQFRALILPTPCSLLLTRTASSCRANTHLWRSYCKKVSRELCLIFPTVPLSAFQTKWTNQLCPLWGAFVIHLLWHLSHHLTFYPGSFMFLVRMQMFLGREYLNAVWIFYVLKSVGNIISINLVSEWKMQTL